MLRDEITKKLSKGFAPFLFREHLSDVAGHGIRSPCTYFPVDSSELFLRESDGNLCGCHTGIIPPRQVPNKAIPGPLRYAIRAAPTVCRRRRRPLTESGDQEEAGVV